jgi:hypothetical protein
MQPRVWCLLVATLVLSAGYSLPNNDDSKNSDTGSGPAQKGEALIDGMPPAQFYAKLYSEEEGSKYRRILFNHRTEDWTRISGKGSDLAKIALRLERDGNYEALYTEIGDLRKWVDLRGNNCQSYRIDFEETLKGKWHLDGEKLVLENLGTATGMVTEKTKHPGITIRFSKDIQSTGLAGSDMTIYVVSSSSGSLK